MDNKFDTTNCIKVVGNEFLTIFVKEDEYYMVDFDGELVDFDKNYDSIQKMFRIFTTIAFNQRALAN